MPSAGAPAFRDVTPLLQPRSIAIVGASIREDTWPARVFRNLRAFGFPGPVYLVNPKYEALYGEPCYPSLAALPGPPDQLVMVVPAAAVPGLLAEGGRAGARSAVVFSGGFAEIGTAAGRAAQDAIAAIAQDQGIRLCGPNCMGNLATRERAVTFAEQTVEDFQPGGFAFVSQSAGFMGAVLRYATQRGVGLSYGIGCGNEADVDVADCLHYLAQDAATRVIGLFLEGVRRPEAFVAACREAAAAGKPVLVLKVGRSAEGRVAAAAHTGALAGAREAFDALCEQLALVQVPGPDAFVEMAELVTQSQRPLGRGLAAVALSGGVRGAVADLGEGLGVPFAALQPETRAGLEAILGVGSGVGNPLDIGWGGLASLDTYLDCLRLLFRDPGVDTVAVQEELPKNEVAAKRAEGFRAMVALAREYDKGIVFYSRGSYAVTDYGRAFHATCPAPFLQELQRSFEAIARLRWYEGARRAVAGEPEGEPERACAPTWRARLGEAAGPLDDAAAFGLLADWGIPVAPWRRAATAAGAVAAAGVLGYPVAVKLSAPGLTHKTEVGGVRLGLGDAAAVAEAAAALLTLPEAASGSLLVQRLAPPGVELLLASRRDPQYGPLLVVGLGGVWVEALQAVRYALAPLDEARARALLAALPGAALLQGYRGRPPTDVDAVVAALLALSRLAVDLGPALDTVEINPFIAGPAGAGGVAVDVVCLPAAYGAARQASCVR
jgi:acetyltransferase